MLDHASAEWLAPAGAAPEARGGRDSGADGVRGALCLGGLGAYAVRQDARRFQFWEASIGARLGLGAAVDYALALGTERIERAVRERAARVRDAACRVRGVRLADPVADGDGACGLSGVVALDVEALGGASAVHAALARARVLVGTSPPGSTALDASRRRLPTLLRVSAHYFSDDADVEALLRGLAECARDTRR